MWLLCRSPPIPEMESGGSLLAFSKFANLEVIKDIVAPVSSTAQDVVRERPQTTETTVVFKRAIVRMTLPLEHIALASLVETESVEGDSADDRDDR